MQPKVSVDRLKLCVVDDKVQYSNAVEGDRSTHVARCDWLLVHSDHDWHSVFGSMSLATIGGTL